MKKLLLIIFVLSSFIAFSQDSNITGVVTYFFNTNLGDKTDIGAKVYIIDSIGNSEFDFESIKQFLAGKAYISYYNSYANLCVKYEQLLIQYGKKKRYADIVRSTNEDIAGFKIQMDEFYNKMVYYNVETDEKFKELDEKVWVSYYNTIKKENIMSRTIGANGDYTITVKDGTYYVFMISKNRKGTSMSEISGKIYCEKVKVANGQTKDVSYNFKAN